MSTLFAIALLASGQNSTITGTLAGQIVMEGFLKLSIPNWMRRLVTRSLGHSCFTMSCYFRGNESKIEQLLVFSQVFLSIALPFSLIPLQLATSNEKLMGPFKNKKWVNICAWGLIIILSFLNIYLIIKPLKNYKNLTI